MRILDFILALALAAAVIIAGYVMYNSGNSDANAEAAGNYINLMFSNTVNDFKNNPNNFIGFDNAAAIAAKIPPSNWVSPGSTTVINDPWGGTVTFAPANINGGTDNGYSMTITDMPEGICAEVASTSTSQTASISINGTDVASNPSYGGTSTTWPAPSASFQVACTANQNTVEWTQSGQ